MRLLRLTSRDLGREQTVILSTCRRGVDAKDAGLKAFQFRAEKSDNQISCGLLDGIPVVWLNDGKQCWGETDPDRDKGTGPHAGAKQVRLTSESWRLKG